MGKWTKPIRAILPSAGFFLVVGTFLAFLAPYQTAGLGWPAVWFYWVGLIAFGTICGQVASHLIGPVSGGWPEWLAYALVSILVAIPVTAAVLTLQAFFGEPTPLSIWPMVFALVWVISAAVSAISYLKDRHAGGQDGSEALAGRALTDKLPVRLRRAEIRALQSEDHYLRVHTSAGDALVLMRLADAIAAVEALDGAQTHRSWWVNRAAVADARAAGGRATLVLSDGMEVPVSRTHAPRLREAGWF